MIATVSVNINKKAIIARYKSDKIDRPNLTVDEFIFNYVMECIQNNGCPNTGTFNKIRETLQERGLI